MVATIFMGQSRLVLFGRLHVCPLQWDLAGQWCPFKDSPLAPVVVSPNSVEAAQWWYRQEPAVGVRVTPPPVDIRLFTDAFPGALVKGAPDTDALSMEWDHLWAYAYPPHQILVKVISKIREHECKIIIVAPTWPSQSWFPDLLELSIEHPWRLPLLPKLLKQPWSDRFHQNLEILHLHAWRLSDRLSRPEDFRGKLHAGFELPRQPPLKRSMRESGGCSLIGVWEEVHILSVSLFP